MFTIKLTFLLCSFVIGIIGNFQSTLKLISTKIYSCVNILFGQTVSPVCKPSQEIKFGVARNEMVNISCQVDADPDDVKFNWMLNNTLETAEIRSFNSNGSTSIVSYVPKYKNSYGVLLCWGSNKVGVQTEPCSFNVIPASK